MASQFPVSYSAQAAMYANGTATQAAGTYYLQAGNSDISQILEGNLRITGNLQVDGSEVVGGSLSAASLASLGAVTAVGAVSGASVAASGAVTAATATVTGVIASGGLVTAGTVGCGAANVTAALSAATVNATTVNAQTVAAPNISCPGTAVITALTVSNDITVNSGDLVMGQVSGEAGQLTAGPVLAAPGMLLPAPPLTLTVAREVVPVTKAITVGAAVVATTFADLNAWINDVRPHKYFISVIAQNPLSDGTINFGSFDYFSYGSSVAGAPPTSAPVTVNYQGRAGLVATSPSVGSGPYQLFFNWGGGEPANVLFVHIKVIM